MQQIAELKDHGFLIFKNTRQLIHMKDIIVSSVPKCYQKVCTREVIQDVFIRGGRLSRSIKDSKVIVNYMDIDRMMAASCVN